MVNIFRKKFEMGRSGLLFIMVLFFLGALYSPNASSATQDWNREQVFAFARAAERAATFQKQTEREQVLLQLIIDAYRFPRRPQESAEQYSKRLLSTQMSLGWHIRETQWLQFLVGYFYKDLALRAAELERFEASPNLRRQLHTVVEQSSRAVSIVFGQTDVQFDGIDGYVPPLPITERGQKPVHAGALAVVRNGNISIEKMDCARFIDHHPSTDVSRTASGAIKELYSPLRQFQVSALMLGHYEPTWRKGQGVVRIVVPAAFPSIYVNEIAKAAKEAEMHTLRLVVSTSSGRLSDIDIALLEPKKPAKKQKKLQLVRCEDMEMYERCVDRISQMGSNLIYDLH